MSVFLWSTCHSSVARRNFTWRWECPCFMGAPTRKMGCHVTSQWICRFDTSGRWGPYLGIYRIPWMCMGMPGVLGWFWCDRGVCLRAGGAHNRLLVSFLQDFPQATCGDTPESRMQTGLCPSCSCVCSWASSWGPVWTQPVQLFVVPLWMLAELYFTWWIHLTLHFMYRHVKPILTIRSNVSLCGHDSLWKVIHNGDLFLPMNCISQIYRLPVFCRKL